MSNFDTLAKEIVGSIGGVDNIEAVTNCMTRLRFSLKDLKKVDEETLKNIKGVQGVVNKNGQFQVVIGTNVSDVCAAIKKLGNFSEDVKASAEKTGVVNTVLGAITAIFQPIIPAICGAGMIKAVLALANAFNWLDTTGSTYTLLAMVADSAFYFLPVFLAISSARRFKSNQFVAAVLGAMLIHPTFTGLVSAGEAITFFGLPVKLVSYGSSVVPAILIVWMASYIEKLANKISPKSVKVFLVPLLTLLVSAPLAFAIVGPLGSIVGDVLYVVFDFLNNQARWVIPVLMGGLCPLFVMTGMHYSFMPVQLAQYATLGYGTLLGPGMLVSNLSQAGACFAIGLKSKDKELKSTAFSSATTALFGITEPALYGVTLPLKRPLYCVMASGAIVGLFAGLTNMRTYSSATAGLTALPVYICDDFSNVRNAAIAMVASIVLSFVLTFFFGGINSTTEKPEAVEDPNAKKDKNVKKLNEYEEISSPLTGEVVSLSEVKDEVFSKEIMGKGVAIQPSTGEVVAPFDGTISAIFPTNHAVGLVNNAGVEVMIHVGLDTVELNGKYYKGFVKNGDSVKKGDKLIEFDIDEIKEAGYDVITPVIITNSTQFVDVIETNQKEVKELDGLLKVFK